MLFLISLLQMYNVPMPISSMKRSVRALENQDVWHGRCHMHFLPRKVEKDFNISIAHAYLNNIQAVMWCFMIEYSILHVIRYVTRRYM
jgi:hypothetical protein